MHWELGTSSYDPKVLPPNIYSSKVSFHDSALTGSGVETILITSTVVNHRCHPLQTDLRAAIKELLDIIRCNCKTGCLSKKCTCRKHGLLYSSACGKYKGVGCDNGVQPESDDTDKDDI